MTKEQFDKQKWGAGMEVVYEGETYDVVSVDFIEKLIQIHPTGVRKPLDAEEREESYSWVRCENVDLTLSQ